MTEHFGWDALFALLCLLSMASALLLLPACLDEGRLSRHLLLGDCRVPCGFLPKRASASGGGSRRRDGDNVLVSEEQDERGNLLLKFPKHRGRHPTATTGDVFEEEGEMDDIVESPGSPKKKSFSLSLSSASALTQFRKGHQDRRKGREKENDKEDEDDDEREALHCGGYEASQQGGGAMTVRGVVACTRGKGGDARRTENEFA